MRELVTMWSNTRMVVLTALTAALYAAVLIPFKIATIVPGFTEVRPGVVVPLVFGLLLGPPPTGADSTSDAALALAGLGGRCARELPRTAAGERVGFVFQNPDHQIFAETVDAEIAFGPRLQGLDTAAVRERVEEALAPAGKGTVSLNSPALAALRERPGPVRSNDRV